MPRHVGPLHLFAEDIPDGDLSANKRQTNNTNDEKAAVSSSNATNRKAVNASNNQFESHDELLNAPTHKDESAQNMAQTHDQVNQDARLPNNKLVDSSLKVAEKQLNVGSNVARQKSGTHSNISNYSDLFYSDDNEFENVDDNEKENAASNGSTKIGEYNLICGICSVH